MSDFVRVKDKSTGHEYSVRHPDPEKVDVLDKPAVDRNGRVLPAVPHVPEPEPADTKHQTTAAKKVAAKPNGVEPAVNPEEGSK